MAKAVDLAAEELLALATPGQGSCCICFCSSMCHFCFLFLLCPDINRKFLFLAVTQVQLNRAKESTKSAVLMNLESRVWFKLHLEMIP